MPVRFSLTVLMLVSGLVLLLLAVPFLLVSLDVLDAAVLRIVPSLIAIALVCGIAVMLAGHLRRAAARKRGE